MCDPENPNFIEIEEIIEERVYEDNNLNVELHIENNEEKEFKFSLKTSVEGDNLLIDTRISFERHEKNRGHNSPHLQWEISNTTSQFFKNGRIHITLLVNSSEELLNCSLGFIVVIGEILNILEKKSELDSNYLVEHFFNQSYYNYKEYKFFLYDCIEKSYYNEGIEIRHKKSFEYSELNYKKKIFFMIKLLFENPIIKPLLEVPTLNRFIEIPEIKKQRIDYNEALRVVKILLENNHKLEQYTPEKFISEYEKF